MQFENDFKEQFQHFQFESTQTIEIQSKIINLLDNGDRDLVSSLSLHLYRNEQNIITITIDNFLTYDTYGLPYTYKNQGYGTQLLNYTIEELNPYLKAYGFIVREITGSLIKKDKNYWTISLSMYYKFSKKLSGKRPNLFLNNKRIYITFLKLIIKIVQCLYEKVDFSFNF